MKKIAITIGDPSGIGPEIVVKALSEMQTHLEDIFPVVFGHVNILERASKSMPVKLKYKTVHSFEQIDFNDHSQIYCFSSEELKTIPPQGQINKIAGYHSYYYIKNAIDATLSKQIDAIATAPINKEALKLAEIPYLDHTEILTKHTNSKEVMTLFVTKNLRVFFYSRHIPFKDISASLNIDDLILNFRNCDHYLKKIGIQNPKIAVAALNPHGGENGMFGSEEIKTIRPAVEEAVKGGLLIEGPIAADSVFHLAAEGYYDAVLSLYHDQGHIAAKTYDFHKTISFTMGLPFLRTSVDHGTAMNLVGKNIANPTSLIEAIKAAAKYSIKI